jgi:hypothetical protein
MSTLTIAGIVFTCVFSGALFGMFLGAVLPKHHLNTDARDVIKVAMAMIATLAALVLGLLTASAKSSLDEKESQLRSAAAQVVLLDRTMLQMERRPRKPAICISRWWPRGLAKFGPRRTQRLHPAPFVWAAALRPFSVSFSIFPLRPTLSVGFNRQRCRPGLHRGSALGGAPRNRQFYPMAVHGDLGIWLAIIFTSFGLFAPRNSPIAAPSKSPAAPLRIALEQLGQS